MEFGRCCKLKVDVEADPSTAGRTGQRSLVERCSEVARSCQSVPLRVALHTNRLNSARFLPLLWACTGCTAPQMILGFRADSSRSAYTLFSKYTRKPLAANSGRRRKVKGKKTRLLLTVLPFPQLSSLIFRQSGKNQIQGI